MNLDQFLLNTSLITESGNIADLGQIINNPKFNNTLKKYLPKTFARYGAVSNTPNIFRKIGMSVSENKELNKYIGTKVDKKESKNLHVKTFEMQDKEINAFTIPGFYIGMKDITLAQSLFGSASAKQYGIDGGIGKSGKAILTASKDITPLIVTTSGFNNDKSFSNDERMAIIMHEIGHWSSSALNKQIPAPVLGMFETAASWGMAIALIKAKLALTANYQSAMLAVFVVFIIAYVVFAIINGMLSRAAEFAADAFAKKVGLGQSLADSLQKLHGYDPVKDLDELNSIAKISDKLSPILDFISATTHPSRHRRVGRLLEDASVLQEGILSDFSASALDKIISPIMGSLDNMVARKFRPMLWAYGSK